MAGEILEDWVFVSSVYGDIAVEGVMGAFSHVGDEDTAGTGTAEVVFEGTGFGGAGITLESRRSNMLGVQRLVHLIEQVLVGEMHFANDY